MTGSAGDSWSDVASRRDAPGRPIGCAVPHWQPVPHPPRTAMVGRFCRVEPLEPARHGEALFAAYAADVEGGMWTYMPYGPFPEAGAFRSWLEARAGADDPLSYAVVEARSGAALGLASHLRIEPAVGVVEIGHIAYAPALQRTAAATEAIALMAARVFALGYRRCEWKCDALNAPSRRAAERLGFTYEGLFRQATIYKGRNRDTAWYAILDHEWPALAAAYRAWLDGIDAAGRQAEPLARIVARHRGAA